MAHHLVSRHAVSKVKGAHENKSETLAGQSPDF
jgi:hypothetical protein